MNVLRGMESLDNAGVYQLRKDLAIIQTVDFFTPIVDDPYTFGQIAVANSLSDVYTMGGTPITALNLVSFPTKKLDISVLKEIMRGGVEKMREAGVILMGGHSIDDPELKYGLAVTGIVHPKNMITNGGARAGDKLILTKPLGTGIISTAIKKGIVNDGLIKRVGESMATLNKNAAEVMRDIGIHSCTDITGFGLLGHISQMAKNSGVNLVVQAAAVPRFEEAVEFDKQGLRPGGLSRNRDFYKDSVSFAASVPEYLQDILYDPQTSGGLFIAVGPRKARRLLDALHEAGVSAAAIVGEATAEPKGIITVV
jgi:selenide,water dikinase